MTTAVDQAIQQINVYRITTLSQQSLTNTDQLVDVKTVVRLMLECGGDPEQRKTLYVDLFEKKLIEATQAHYEKVRGSIDQAASMYLRTIDRIFQSEDDLVERYLSQASFSLLNSTIYEELIKKNTTLLSTCFATLLPANDFEALNLLYAYSFDTGMVSKLADEWCKYVHAQGLAILRRTKSEPASILEVIRALINLKWQTDKVIDDCFRGSDPMRNAQTQSFQELFNMRN